MNVETYVRKATARERRRDRDAAEQAIREELDMLIAEAVAEGADRSEAERRAVETHRRGRLPWADPWTWRAFLTAPWTGSSWRALAFLVALFVVGLASFLWATAAGLTVAGLFVVVVGFFLAGPFLLTLPSLGRLHGALAAWGTRQPMPLLHTSVRVHGTTLERLRQRLADPQIVHSFLSCFVTYLLGTVGFAWVAGLGAASVYLLLSPVVPALPVFPGQGWIYPDWVLASPLRRLVVGVVVLWPLTWGAQALAWLSARAIRGVLTRT